MKIIIWEWMFLEPLKVEEKIKQFWWYDMSDIKFDVLNRILDNSNSKYKNKYSHLIRI